MLNHTRKTNYIAKSHKKETSYAQSQLKETSTIILNEIKDCLGNQGCNQSNTVWTVTLKNF